MTDSLAIFEALLTIGAVMIPCVTGCATWNIVASKQSGKEIPTMGGASIAVGCAIVVHALLCQATLMVAVASPATVIFCDLVLMLVVLAVSVTRERNEPSESINRSTFDFTKQIADFRRIPIADQLGWAVFAAVLSLFIVFVFIRINVSPMGDWDAWIIWNTKARLLYLSPESWVAPLRSYDWWRHPDYPITHSASVARVWFWAGETRLAPILIGLQYPLLCTILIVSLVVRFRNPLIGIAAGMILLASPVYQETFWAQCADGPLAFFFLASGAALILGGHSSNPQLWWLLSGFIAGLATTIKNEGLAWWGILAMVLGISALLKIGAGIVRWDFLKWLGISTVFVAMTMGIKLWISAENDILQSKGDWASLLADSSRHVEVAKTMALRWLGVLPDAAREPGAANKPQSVGLGAVGLVALMLVIVTGKIRKRPRPEISILFVSLIVFAAVCYVVFVLTPHNLSWHLFSAAHRVVAQMWPLAVLLCFLLGTDDHQTDISEGTQAAHSAT